MDNCTCYFKNTSTSSSHANFRLDIFHSKTLLYSLWRRENCLKAGRTYKIFSHLNILHIAFTYSKSYIIHLTPGTSYSVMGVMVAAQVLSAHNC